MSDHIRPEIQALIDRGNVTLEELHDLRCNSWEWDALVPAMTDEALIARAQYALDNSRRPRIPSVTYDESVIGVFAPELMRRLVQASAASQRHMEKWWEYEQKYILPCFQFAEESGIDLHAEVRNSPGTNCVVLLVRALQAQAREAVAFAETIDNVREALGQKATHYLIIADDVRLLVDAVEKQGGPALELLRELRER